MIPAGSIGPLLERLRSVSDAWLETRNTREKGFSLGFFDETYLKQFPLAVVYFAGEIVAFANVWQGAGKEELSVDLMRFTPDLPPVMMDYLFVELMLWGQKEGYRWFNLGVCPLSGLENRRLAPASRRVGAVIYRHGENFYNFQGLRAYKEKFEPEWTPVYLACPGGLVLPRVAANIVALVSGGLKGAVAR
jgi:phosphatidylglycerol lysyltransferase